MFIFNIYLNHFLLNTRLYLCFC